MLLVVATLLTSAGFSVYYSNIYINSVADSNAFYAFSSLYNLTSSNPSVDMSTIDIEILEQCINQLKLGKVAGAHKLVADTLFMLLLVCLA